MSDMFMKEAVSRISTYSADTFGVCSALFELGGMTVIHDPSGCNSTYTTHDEPRWYDTDSLIFITGLTEMDAVLGNEEKLLHDVETAAAKYQPRFITLLCTPVPLLMGTDFPALAKVLQKRTGLPVFFVATNSMQTYEQGIFKAFKMVAEHMVAAVSAPSSCCSWQPSFASQGQGLKVNILGVTPLDFAVNGSEKALRRCLTRQGFAVSSLWAMGSVYEEIRDAGRAEVNLVASYGGLGAATVLQERFSQPYVVGLPLPPLQEILAASLRTAAATGRVQYPLLTVRQEKETATVIIGESVYATSLAAALERVTGEGVDVCCPLAAAPGTLGARDHQVRSEGALMEVLQAYKTIIADPLYEAIIPEGAKFIPLGHEAFSGRLYQASIPNLFKDFNSFFHI